MPKMSKASTEVKAMGPAEEWSEILDGYEASIVKVNEEADLAALLKGLPDDRCPCPHWGFVFKGKLTWTYADHVEVYEAGDAFYTPPGHTPGAEKGSEFLLFSPAELAAEVGAVMERNVKAMQGS